MGALIAQLTGAATAAIKRRAIVYGLGAASGLLGLFAAAYAVDALYTFLALRWGLVAASLAVSGVLLLSAFIAALAGYLASRTPSKSLAARVQASSEVSAAKRRLAGSKRSLAPTFAGALAGAVAVMTLAFLRRAGSLTEAREKTRSK